MRTHHQERSPHASFRHLGTHNTGTARRRNIGQHSRCRAPLACGGISTGSFSGSAGGSEYLCAKEGDLLDVRIGDVHATQPSLGYDEVYYKLGRYTLGKDTINKKFDDWCEANGQIQAATATAASTLKDPSSFTCQLRWVRKPRRASHP